MNYRDHFKREAMMAKLKDVPQGQSFDDNELKMGTAHEKEYTNDDASAAVIAKQHLSEDPHYYSKMKNAGLNECGSCGCGEEDDSTDQNGGMPKLGGALAVGHYGQPIHMSKIIQVGPSLGKGPASGVLSGMTAVEKKGVNVDTGGVEASVEGDKETITAGGEESDPSIATKSVGGPVVPNKGQKQGGINTKGTYANTAKMNSGEKSTRQTPLSAIGLQESHKKAIRNVVKEVLKEITFDKKKGKWVRIDENRYGSMNPDSSAAQYPSGQLDKMSGELGPEDTNEELNMKMGPAYKTTRRQYRTSDDDWARQVEYEPEITEQYDEEEESKLQEQYRKLLTKQTILKENEMVQLKKLKGQLERMNERKEKWMKGAIDPEHKGYCTPMTKSTCTPSRKALAKRFKSGDLSEEDKPIKMPSGPTPSWPEGRPTYHGPATIKQPKPIKGKEDDEDEKSKEFNIPLEEEGVMKMGPSHKVVQPRMYQVSDDDWARTNQYNPEITEAGGGAVQYSSYRVQGRPDHGNLPQDSKTRWANDLDETAKKSEVQKTIQKGIKAKKSTPQQKLAYKGAKKTKSGVHKKKNV